MFNRLNEVLQTAADVVCFVFICFFFYAYSTKFVFQLAPPPTALQDFEYHWKQVKCFYTVAAATDAKENQPNNKCHMNDTKLPYHLEEMLQIIIFEEQQRAEVPLQNSEINAVIADEMPPPPPDVVKTQQQECLEFVLATRPLDLLSELAASDSPPGATVCILNWIRRFLSCLRNPCLEQESIFQPVQVLKGFL